MSNSTEPQCWGDVLARCAGLDRDDWSLEARQVRATAASIRDHRASKCRQTELNAMEREDTQLTAARLLYEERDAQRLLAEAEEMVGNWEQAALHAIDMKRLSNEAEKYVHLAIEQKNIAQRAGIEYEQLLAANQAYDREVAERKL
jgi:hypothetical protein